MSALALWVAGGDTIGLSRSRHLEGPYIERHPLQVIDPCLFRRIYFTLGNSNDEIDVILLISGLREMLVRLSGLQIMIAPQPDPSFDSTWTGWPRALLDESAGKTETRWQ